MTSGNSVFQTSVTVPLHFSCLPLGVCKGTVKESIVVSHGRLLHNSLTDKYSLLMHCIKIKSPVKFLLNEQYVFVGGNISFLCVLSCSSEEA